MGDVAICHDYLLQMGGAERVVLAMSDVFPSAPIYTTFYAPASTYSEFRDRDVRALASVPGDVGLRIQRSVFPVMRSAIERLRVRESVAICSTSGWSHAVVGPERKVAYCHNPARWLYQEEDYFQGRIKRFRVPTAPYRKRLREWDRKAANSIELYLANSSVVRERIRRTYGREAEVLFPPAGLETDGSETAPSSVPRPFCLVVGRLQPYKHVPFIARTFRSALPDLGLVVVGSGPERAALDALSSNQIVRLDRATDAELRWLYRNAELLIAASHEDFGLTPVEAAFHGLPTVALRYGGYRDTVLPGRTGILFADLSPESLIEAIRAALNTSWDRSMIAASAEERFGRRRFGKRLTSIVDASPSAGAGA